MQNNDLVIQSERKKTREQIIALFFIQASSTIAYAVFYSGLSIFLTQNKHYSHETSAIITGLFLSLNYVLPLIGGILTNKLITYKNLYYLGTITSIVGCLLLTNGNFLHLSLALFLMGSLSNVCLNMFVTQLFSSEQKKQRRIAFTWNYIGMNLGFMIGYFCTGFSTISNSYNYLFILISCMVFVSIGIVFFFIDEPDQVNKDKFTFNKLIICTMLVSFLVLFIKILFDYAEYTRSLLTISSVSMLAIIIIYSLKKSNLEEKKKIIRFMCFSIIAIVFWSVYLLTPIAIMQLIHSSVQRNILGITLAPQWFANINSIVIMMLAPLITILIKKSRDNHGYLANTSNYFSAGFLFACIAFTVLFIGLSCLKINGEISPLIICGYLISLTIGEILIFPASNALIGELIKEPLRGIMTGVWGMNIAIGGLFSSMIASRFILPYVNNNRITVQNSIQLQNVFLMISFTLFIFVIISPLITNQWPKLYNRYNE